MRDILIISLNFYVLLDFARSDSFRIPLSIEPLVQKDGYPLEIHEVTTEDGYILEMLRIPHGRNGVGVNKKPLLILHGLYVECEHYIITGPHNTSLAFISADYGYDVWLGNSRGTLHGKKHRYLNPRGKDFWNFSFHEIGMYDLPAMIEYILRITGKPKLQYIAHSQGASAFYVMCSEKPQYQGKIVMASLMAPAGFLGNVTSTIFKPLAYSRKLIQVIADAFFFYEYPPGNLLQSIFTAICVTPRSKKPCENFLDIFNGGHSGEMEVEMLPLIIRYLPNGAIKQLIHFFQLMTSGKFRQWDYEAKAENIKHYGAPDPPDYKVENIHVPIAIYNGYGDVLVNYKDVQRMCSLLPNCLKIETMKNPKWSHLDFAFAKNAPEVLYKPLLEYMEGFD